MICSWNPRNFCRRLNRINGFFLADMMANRAREETDIYFAPWAAAVQAIGLEGPTHVQMLFCVDRT